MSTRDFLCNLPLGTKMLLGSLKTYANGRKVEALKALADASCNDFPSLNTKDYKNNLRNYLVRSAFSADETRNYITWLYGDKITKIRDGETVAEWPYIICVVKNEKSKLVEFMRHYQALGNFNYVFIDNGSTDGTLELLNSYNVIVYQCLEKFSTKRKLSWINKVYSTLPVGTWTILLDADELLVYDGYEKTNFNQVINKFNHKNIKTAAAVMIDMFSLHPCNREEYFKHYLYFENSFHEEKSYYFNSIYGGIREREFKFTADRIFLIKKHPIVKKEKDTMLIHCHYIYPFNSNFEAVTYFGLLHYKLFDSEIKKYQDIAENGSYGNGSIEYKTYINTFKNKTYDEIFKPDDLTIKYEGTPSLERIKCLHDVREI